jgi:hypothetical protein
VAISEFDILAINKGSSWKYATSYAVGATVTDTNGVAWKCVAAHTSGIDNAPGNGDYWSAGNYVMTIGAYSNGQTTAWADYAYGLTATKNTAGVTLTTTGTPESRVSYPDISSGTVVSIVNKSMALPLQLDTGAVATFLNYSLK